ncbi:ABC transporter permease subunit [bacterium BFN5]|nr:ABC transporter permease subunit [bacterium BFN5]
MTNLFGEFFGTMVLMIFGCGVVANCLLKKSKAEGAGWMVITAGWAFAVTLGVFMLLFGLGESSKILMIFLIIVFQVIIAVRDGVKGIPKETYYPLYSLGAGFKDICRDILIPASMPKFLTSLRVAMATAVSVLFFTETFGTTYGMGYFIMDAWMRVNYLEMYSGIAVLSNIGLILFGTIDYIERKTCSWQYK